MCDAESGEPLQLQPSSLCEERLHSLGELCDRSSISSRGDEPATPRDGLLFSPCRLPATGASDTAHHATVGSALSQLSRDWNSCWDMGEGSWWEMGESFEGRSKLCYTGSGKSACSTTASPHGTRETASSIAPSTDESIPAALRQKMPALEGPGSGCAAHTQGDSRSQPGRSTRQSLTGSATGTMSALSRQTWSVNSIETLGPEQRESMRQLEALRSRYLSELSDMLYREGEEELARARELKGVKSQLRQDFLEAKHAQARAKQQNLIRWARRDQEIVLVNKAIDLGLLR
ncbi:unnamed protein product [Chrysoparadoxa australica]